MTTRFKKFVQKAFPFRRECDELGNAMSNVKSLEKHDHDVHMSNWVSSAQPRGPYSS